ncbi:unnamed protein product, partial [Iphiclides podalirius]
MLFKLGLLFAAICLGVAFARLPCQCPLVSDPVCGSNGQTYGSMCFLDCARLREPNVTLASVGPCEINSGGVAPRPGPRAARH